MGLLDQMLSWVNRIVILISVVLLTLTTLSKDVPLSQATMRVGHLCSFSVWFGTSVWVSFVAGVVLIRAINIDNFGLAQAKLFDAYFKFSLLCLAFAGFTAAALTSTSFSAGQSDGEGFAAMRATPFFVALASVVANLVFFSPQTTVTMMERRRVCRELGVERDSKDPQVRKLSKRFGMFHGITNLLNLVALACGCVHLVALAERLSL